MSPQHFACLAVTARRPRGNLGCGSSSAPWARSTTRSSHPLESNQNLAFFRRARRPSTPEWEQPRAGLQPARGTVHGCLAGHPSSSSLFGYQRRSYHVLVISIRDHESQNRSCGGPDGSARGRKCEGPPGWCSLAALDAGYVDVTLAAWRSSKGRDIAEETAGFTRRLHVRMWIEGLHGSCLVTDRSKIQRPMVETSNSADSICQSVFSRKS